MADEDTFLFTSESVNEGHPDKLADQVREELEERKRERKLRERQQSSSNGNIRFGRYRAPRTIATLISFSSFSSLSQTHNLSPITGLRRHPRCVPRAGPRRKGKNEEKRKRNNFAGERRKKKKEQKRDGRIFPPDLDLFLTFSFFPKKTEPP